MSFVRKDGRNAVFLYIIEFINFLTGEAGLPPQRESWPALKKQNAEEKQHIELAKQRAMYFSALHLDSSSVEKNRFQRYGCQILSIEMDNLHDFVK
ncbi:hypothetical protein M5W83_26015 [Paenibacillus thiaminolyticus]|uniref:Uncharacterized protein n=1 Tax=Paenibacillus thiaminolyticus TaxID=49283 RepID=A0AAP9DY52_PANTH|nr:hypothetical protein [Paenibacillus thiaminolyticus]MCY9538938.1 hypothetical protein [Paenibacillus thiaminolyticus]MCY9603406.1 hypothetical protein [Paenibacillus thiaminolyticus]MCY9610609.1 hypothetical protein [Paenibacillus thiaminolyticus]MCY9616409.1 hypothetical protein [Paenibacillus thiaminolyticus]MCY9621307.1 hypothetical protein [Paenibacillus thiaminolyticus]